MYSSHFHLKFIGRCQRSYSATDKSLRSNFLAQVCFIKINIHKYRTKPCFFEGLCSVVGISRLASRLPGLRYKLILLKQCTHQTAGDLLILFSED